MPKAIKVVNTAFVTFTIPVPWDDLLEMDIEALNDLAQEEWYGAQGKGYLSDIGYTLNGHEGQNLLIEVTAQTEEE